ncbi:MAG: hypothetical protein IPG76_00665 [Acidobacteria bacterium]|nr:hypothetical protein [Acidobacteriota bacterium]
MEFRLRMEFAWSSAFRRNHTRRMEYLLHGVPPSGGTTHGAWSIFAWSSAFRRNYKRRMEYRL